MKYFAIIAFAFLLASNTSGCFAGHGLSWQYDGTTHSFSWWSTKP